MTTNLVTVCERDVTAPNKRVILASLLEGGRLSRVEIARLTGLAPASVNRLAAAMVKSDLIVEAGSDETTGGRPSVLFEFNPDARQILALDVTPQSIEVATVNLAGNITSRGSYATEGARGEKLAKKLVELTKELVQTNTDDRPQRRASIGTLGFAAIGVSVPGPVDDHGVVTVAPALGWHDLDLDAMFRDALDVGASTGTGELVSIENDMNLYALAEWAQEYHDLGSSLAVLGVYHGIGLGIVEGGRVWRGRAGSGGQMGRMYMNLAGFTSKAHAEFGQMETMLGASALRDYAIQVGVIPVNSKTADPLFELAAEAKQGAAEGDSEEAQEALVVVEKALQGYALQIANVVAILAPDTLVMAGLFEDWSDLVIPILEEQLAGTVLQVPELVPSALGGDAKLIGAALYALEESGGILALA